MATDVKQNLSLGKLRRAVDGNNSYSAAASMSQMSGSSATSPAPVKMSDFSISAVNEGLSGFTYLWEQTAEDYEMEFSNEGGLFNKRIANRTENLSWSFDGNLGVTIGSADYIAQVTAPSITNTDGAIAGTFNQSGSLKAKFAEDGQSDGFNDHATRYNTSVSKSIEVVDTYGGVPSCLLFGSMVSKSDGSVVKVEDLNVGDSILTVSLQGSTDESAGDWKNDTFNQSGSFTQHSASVQRVLYEFSQHYYNINSGSEYITGEHHMLYRQAGNENWVWKTAPNFSVGDYLMDKNGNEVVISSLEQHIDPDGYEVVQLDVEPDDFYIGQSFLVHNKGSNDEPSYPSTKFSNQAGDFTMGGDMGDTVISDLKTIQLANGSGNTAITNSQTSAGNVTLTIALSTSGDPGTGGSDNSGTGFISFPKNDLSFTSGTLRYRIKAVAAASGDGTGTATISFTNNGVTNSDMDITLNFT
jgi:hypothetical protein|tara:strand:- start:1178 stop:2587 length:1410 start_codon:yes stop_codon:yes gene_type:complete